MLLSAALKMSGGSKISWWGKVRLKSVATCLPCHFYKKQFWIIAIIPRGEFKDQRAGGARDPCAQTPFSQHPASYKAQPPCPRATLGSRCWEGLDSTLRL